MNLIDFIWARPLYFVVWRHRLFAIQTHRFLTSLLCLDFSIICNLEFQGARQVRSDHTYHLLCITFSLSLRKFSLPKIKYETHTKIKSKPLHSICWITIHNVTHFPNITDKQTIRLAYYTARFFYCQIEFILLFIDFFHPSLVYTYKIYNTQLYGDVIESFLFLMKNSRAFLFSFYLHARPNLLMSIEWTKLCLCTNDFYLHF